VQPRALAAAAQPAAQNMQATDRGSFSRVTGSNRLFQAMAGDRMIPRVVQAMAGDRMISRIVQDATAGERATHLLRLAVLASRERPVHRRYEVESKVGSAPKGRKRGVVCSWRCNDNCYVDVCPTFWKPGQRPIRRHPGPAWPMASLECLPG
jgi:hypothetical protein